MAKAKAKKPVEVSSQERQRLELAYEVLAAALPHCVIAAPIERMADGIAKNIPKTEIVSLDDFERLCTGSRRSLPEIIDPATSESIGVVAARKKFTCSKAAFHLEAELNTEEARTRPFMGCLVREYTPWYDETLKWLEAKRDKEDPGKIRVTLDEILEPSIAILQERIPKIGMSQPIFLADLHSERAVHRQLNERQIAESERFAWTMDVLPEVENRLPAAKEQAAKLNPGKRRVPSPPSYKIVSTQDGRFYAKMPTGKSHEFHATKTHKVILTSMFNERRRTQDEKLTYEATHTDFDAFGVAKKPDAADGSVSIPYASLRNDFKDVKEDSVRSYVGQFNEDWRTLTEEESVVLYKTNEEFVVLAELEERDAKAFGITGPSPRRNE